MIYYFINDLMNNIKIMVIILMNNKEDLLRDLYPLIVENSKNIYCLYVCKYWNKITLNSLFYKKRKICYVITSLSISNNENQIMSIMIENYTFINFYKTFLNKIKEKASIINSEKNEYYINSIIQNKTTVNILAQNYEKYNKDNDIIEEPIIQKIGKINRQNNSWILNINFNNIMEILKDITIEKNIMNICLKRRINLGQTLWYKFEE
jgi:hypothetical protein